MLFRKISPSWANRGPVHHCMHCPGKYGMHAVQMETVPVLIKTNFCRLGLGERNEFGGAFLTWKRGLEARFFKI